MLSKSEEMDCLWADELMRAVRENMDSDREKAKTAFGEIYQKYKSILWMFCTHVCGDDGNADLVYEITWQKIWKNPTYDYNIYKVSFKAWMAVIAKRTWFDIKKKAILGSDEEMKELPVEPEDFELVDTGEVPDMKVKVLEEALHQLTEKEYDVLMTYIEYDTDQKKHIPDNILAVLTTKYQTTAVNLRQIKCRALKKVKDYIEQHR